MKRILALAAVTAALASSFAFAQAPEKKDVHISVGGKPALYYLPLTIAEQLGYFKDEGLNVKISDFAGGSQSLQAVVGGSADVVSGAFEHTINMQAKKISMIAFVQMGRAPQISIGISKAKAASYKGPADLKGLKFGVSAPGSSTNIILNAFIAKGGLKPNDVAIVGVGTGAGAIAAVKSGQIDGTSNTDPVMTKLELDGALKIIADARTMKGTEAIFGGPLPAASLYAPTKWVRENPNTVQALTNAIVRADKWIAKASAPDVAKTVPAAYLLGDQALYLFAFDKVKDSISTDGMISEPAVKNMLKVLASYNPEIKPAEIKLNETFTNDFVKKANAKYK
ncbi:MAG TPA: ABC transporter substrate-binding protein [Burkholderiales bacterium]|jgi:NitT/TauT family transport system substrate-binding protein|nr:ABC transporter substrate-binding protein [Burkholderiales bacterium]